jgi:hypothetical protein
MHPWIAEQLNREHIAELRSLSRPFGVSPVGWRVGRQWITRAQPKRVWRGLSSRRRPLTVRF